MEPTSRCLGDPPLETVRPSRISRGCPTTEKRKVVRPPAGHLQDIASLHGLKMPAALSSHIGAIAATSRSGEAASVAAAAASSAVGAAAIVLSLGVGTNRQQVDRINSKAAMVRVTAARRKGTPARRAHGRLLPPAKLHKHQQRRQSVLASIDLSLPDVAGRISRPMSTAESCKWSWQLRESNIDLVPAHTHHGSSGSCVHGQQPGQARPGTTFHDPGRRRNSTNTLNHRLHFEYHHRYGLDSLPRSVGRRPETQATYVHFVAAPVTPPPSHRGHPAGVVVPPEPAVRHLPALDLPRGCEKCSVVRVGGGYITVGWTNAEGRCTKCLATLDYKCVDSPPWFTSVSGSESKLPATTLPLLPRQPKTGQSSRLPVYTTTAHAEHDHPSEADKEVSIGSDARRSNSMDNAAVHNAALNCNVARDAPTSINLPTLSDVAKSRSTMNEAHASEGVSSNPPARASSINATNSIASTHSVQCLKLNVTNANSDGNASATLSTTSNRQSSQLASFRKSSSSAKGRVAELRLGSRPASSKSGSPRPSSSSARCEGRPQSGKIMLASLADRSRQSSSGSGSGRTHSSSRDDDGSEPMAVVPTRLRKKMPKARKKMPQANKFKGTTRRSTSRPRGGRVNGSTKSTLGDSGLCGFDRGHDNGDGTFSSSSSTTSLSRHGSGRHGSGIKPGNAEPGSGLVDVKFFKGQLTALQAEPAPLKRDSAALDLLERACKTATSEPSIGRFRKMYKKGSAGKGTLRQYRRAILQEQSKGQAISQEVDYALAVLGIGSEPGAEKSLESFEEFASVVLLVEKIRNLDSFLRQTIQALNPRQFQDSFAKAKQLYYCNDPTGQGSIGLEVIELELRAGNVSTDRRKNIMHYLADQGLEELTFLDYLSYLPLFIHIHENVLDNPLAKI